MKLITILLLSALFISTYNQPLYRLIKHSKERGAACLDGSPAALYIHEGSGKNKDKFFIHMMGGGFCGESTFNETVESCYKRSDTIFGSSKEFPPLFDFDAFGVLATEKSKNPVFWDWTKVFIIYCDGSIHVGNRENPINYKGKDLYFRGSRNALEHFRYLDEHHNFYNKERIVLSGLSAGGIGTYYWVDYLKEHTKTAKVVAIPDSGVFIDDFFSPIAQKQVTLEKFENLLKVVGMPSGDDLPVCVQKCLNDTKNESLCTTTPAYLNYIQSPLLIIQSTYDQWAIDNIVLARCKTDSMAPYSIENCSASYRDAIEQYRNKTIEKLNTMKGDRSDVGFWVPACVQHGYTFDSTLVSNKFRIPTTTGKHVYEAIQQFLDNPNSAPVYMDKEQWPTNTGCSGEHQNYPFIDLE